MALTLTDTWALTSNSLFLARTRAAIALTAYDVLNESPATPFHAERVALAQSSLRGPSESPFFAWLLVHPLIQSDGAAISDANLSAVISALWNVAAGAATAF